MIIDNEHDENGLEQFYSFTAIAQALEVNERTVRRWVDAGELIAHRLGGRRRVSQSDLDSFLNERREG